MAERTQRTRRFWQRHAFANCDEFAEKLPDKWNTNIGENGCELSGGERQRISIARAFLKDAPIILLDEATASLDVENETAIQTALSRLIKNKTVLVIAHRMRTVAGADKIVVLSDGTAAEQGTPAELFEQNGIFKKNVRLAVTKPKLDSVEHMYALLHCNVGQIVVSARRQNGYRLSFCVVCTNLQITRRERPVWRSASCGRCYDICIYNIRFLLSLFGGKSDQKASLAKAKHTVRARTVANAYGPGF